MNSDQPKKKWQPIYTLVLAANLVYIIIFYFITQAYN